MYLSDIMSYSSIVRAIKLKANPTRAKCSRRFFRTGKGEYGEGDVFLGLTVPEQRIIAKRFCSLAFFDIRRLLKDKNHEFRFIALLVLVYKFSHADEKDKKRIFNFYMSNLARVNNWDLVDISSHAIVGKWLIDKDAGHLYNLAKSKNLWKRRVAIVATATFIREGKLEDTFNLSKLLINDSHDLIHKAVGWMLREAGKKDVVRLESFLKIHYKTMPRTMLRYAIEKFPEQRRTMCLKGLI